MPDHQLIAADFNTKQDSKFVIPIIADIRRELFGSEFQLGRTWSAVISATLALLPGERVSQYKSTTCTAKPKGSKSAAFESSARANRSSGMDIMKLW